MNPQASVEGVLERTPQGHGFLRSAARAYLSSPGDVQVPAGLIQKLGLREGQHVAGLVEASRKGAAAGPRLVSVEKVEGVPQAEFKPPRFDDLTPIDPTQRISLETSREPLTTRVMDLLTPIGRGRAG